MRPRPTALLFGMLAIGLATLARAGTTLHVDDSNTTGTEDGTAAHPFNTIQEAVNAATDGDTVKVAAGTYRETVTLSAKGLSLLGGYPGGANYAATPGDFDDAHRDWNANATTIDGEDARRCVYLDAAGGEISGFTITRGRASTSSSAWPDHLGGGIACFNSSAPTIASNNITSCSGWIGAGIGCYQSAPTIAANVFGGDQAQSNGGGIYCKDNSPATIEGNTFSGCSAGSGGGVMLVATSATISGNTFTSNYGQAYGGAILCYDGSSPTISGNTISDNTTSGQGAAIACITLSSPTITGNMITGNTAASYAGALWCQGDCSPALTNNVIAGNSAGNCGGALFLYTRSSPTLTNNTLVGNTCPNYGGAIYIRTDSSPALTNCIVWGNSAKNDSQLAASIDFGHPCTLTVSYSDVQGGQAKVWVEAGCTLDWGAGNLDSDPLFGNPGAGDYHLKSRVGRYQPGTGSWTIDAVHSPCIDAGDPASPIGAEPMPNGARINMGAWGGTAEASKGKVLVHLASEPAGLQVTLGGVTGPAPQTTSGVPGDPLTIPTPPTPQASGTPGMRYAFSHFADDQDATIPAPDTVPSEETTYTAVFTEEYLLTTAVAPPEAQAAGCSVVRDLPGPWYPAGQDVELIAIAFNDWVFTQWSDGEQRSDRTVHLDSPMDLAANFGPPAAMAISSAPDLDFGNVVVGDVAELADAYTVTNTGAGPLSVTINVEAPFQVYVAGGTPGTSCSFTLGAGEEKKVSFTFAPIAVGRATEPIFIFSNGGNEARTATGVGVLPVVTVEATDAAADELGPDTGEFTVTRSGGVGLSLTVPYSIGGKAKNGTDYERLTGSAVIPEGQLSAPISIVPLRDGRCEPDETVTLTLKKSKTYLIDKDHKKDTVTIADGEPTVSITATDPDAAELGADPAEFTITRNRAFDVPLTVRYSVSGSAKNGTDYPKLSGEALIPEGEAAVTIQVVPANDALCERDETIKLKLKKSTAYYIDAAQSSATATIADGEPTVSIVATSPAAAEEGRAAGEFTVTRSLVCDTPLEVKYSVKGTAKNGVDYDLLTRSVTIPAGQATATIALTPADDIRIEPDETVIVTPSKPKTYYLDAAQQSATVVIADNDPAVKPVVTIEATVPTLAENAAGAGEFTVRRTGATEAALKVLYSVAGKAKNGTDYQKLPGYVTIPAGQAAAAIQVKPRDDTRFELDEPVTLTLKPSVAYSLDAAQQTATVTILDND